MNRFGDEVVAESVHLHQRGHSGAVTKVVAVLALGECWTGGRLDAPDRRVHLASHLLAHERKRQTAEVGAASRAAHE